MSINERKRTGTLRVLLASPMRSWELLAADTVSALTSVAISAAFVIPFSLVLGAEYRYFTLSKLFAAILLLTIGTLFTVGLGLLIAPLAKTPEGASALVNFIAFPTMFIGGLTIPKDVLPETLKLFADHYPLTMTIDAVRKMVIHGYSVGEALALSLPAATAALIIYGIGAYIYRRLLENAVERP